MKRQELIIEKAEKGFFGRIQLDDNLIIEEGSSIVAIEKSIKKIVRKLHHIEITEFDIKYDLSSLFETFSYLKISSVAEKAGVNPGLLRQYVSGVKFPSALQAAKIETTIHEISEELGRVKIYSGD